MSEQLNLSIELEFTSENYNYLFDKLKENNIDYTFTGDSRISRLDKIVIKPEASVRGLELNIPYTETFETLRKICDIFDNHVILTNNCCLHLHYPIANIEDCDKIYNYYCANEQSIIAAAQEQNMYVNLNKPTATPTINPIRYLNMNVYKAYEMHGTVEHRIYKATFNYNKLVWAINQTKQIISNALSQ